MAAGGPRIRQQQCRAELRGLQPVKAIPDFSDTELWSVKTALKERFGRDVEVELAETELRLNPHTSQLTSCPAIYWNWDDCNFIISKTGEDRYRSQFFYRLHQMFSTGIEEYDDITECVVTLLQVQADQAALEAEK